MLSWGIGIREFRIGHSTVLIFVKFVEQNEYFVFGRSNSNSFDSFRKTVSIDVSSTLAVMSKKVEAISEVEVSSH